MKRSALGAHVEKVDLVDLASAGLALVVRSGRHAAQSCPLAFTVRMHQLCRPAESDAAYSSSPIV